MDKAIIFVKEIAQNEPDVWIYILKICIDLRNYDYLNLILGEIADFMQISTIRILQLMKNKDIELRYFKKFYQQRIAQESNLIGEVNSQIVSLGREI